MLSTSARRSIRTRPSVNRSASRPRRSKAPAPTCRRHAADVGRAAALRDVGEMQAESSRAPVGEEKLERHPGGPEGDLVPGYLLLGEQLRLERLRPRDEVGVEHARSIEQVDLAD